MKPSTMAPSRLELPAQRSSGSRPSVNFSTSTAFGTTVTFRGSMPRATISERRPSQMVVTASARLQCVGFERARESIARRALSRAAVIDRGVFPEGANFVDVPARRACVPRAARGSRSTPASARATAAA